MVRVFRIKFDEFHDPGFIAHLPGDDLAGMFNTVGLNNSPTTMGTLLHNPNRSYANSLPQPLVEQSYGNLKLHVEILSNNDPWITFRSSFGSLIYDGWSWRHTAHMK